MAIIPIFVSSTFRDFHGERDVLNTEVRGRLDDAVEHLGCRVSFVDLRWGVDTDELEFEEERHRRVFEVCLSEIDRARPLFIGLIGRRCGWRPPTGLAERVASAAGIHEPGQQWSITEYEFHHGARALRDGTTVCFVREFRTEPPEGWVDDDTSSIDRLRERVTGFDPAQVIRYDVDVAEGRISDVDRRTFADLAQRALLEPVMSRAGELSRENLDPYETAETAFIEDRTRVLLGRQPLIDRFVGDLVGRAARVCLVGPPGTGKSAVWSAVVRRLRTEGRSVASIALGATTGSTSEESVVVRLAIGIDFDDDPTEPLDARRFRVADALAGTCGVVVAIDSLDSLAPGIASDQLPLLVALAATTAVVCTTTSDDHARLLARVGYEIVRLNDLSASDFATMAREIALAERRTLPAAVVDAIAGRSNVPLWYHLAVGELAALGEDELANLPDGAAPISALLARTSQELSPTVDALADRILDRVERQFGSEVVGRVMATVAAARSGISPEDTATVARCSLLDVVSMRRRSAGMLVARGGAGPLMFSHVTLRAAATRRFGDLLPDVHGALADHFAALSARRPDHLADVVYHGLLSDGGHPVGPYLRAVVSKPDRDDALVVGRAVAEALPTLATSAAECGDELMRALRSARSRSADGAPADDQRMDLELVDFFRWWDEDVASTLTPAEVRRSVAEAVVRAAEALAPPAPPTPGRLKMTTGLWRLDKLSNADIEFYDALLERDGAVAVLAVASARRILARTMLDCGRPRREANAQLAQAKVRLNELAELFEYRLHGEIVARDPVQVIDDAEARRIAARVADERVQVGLVQARASVGIGQSLGVRQERKRVEQAVGAARQAAFAAAPGGDAARALAEALTVAAEFLITVDEYSDARRNCDAAAAHVQPLLHARPTLDTQLLEVRNLVTSARVEEADDTIAATSTVGRALDRAALVARLNPTSADASLLHGRALGLAAANAARTGDKTSARALSDRELTVTRSVVEQDDSNVDARQALSEALRRSADFADADGRVADQRSRIQEADDLRVAIQRADPIRDMSGIRTLRSRALTARFADGDSKLGSLVRSTSRSKAWLAVDKLIDAAAAARAADRHDDAIGQLREALLRLDESVRSDRWPDAEAREMRVKILYDFGRSENALKRYRDGAEHSLEEVDLRRQALVAATRRKQRRRAQSDLALSLFRTVLFHHRSDQPEVALRYVTEAVQELDQAILDPPDNHDYRDNLRTLLNVLEPVARSHGQRDVACDLAGRRASEFRNEHRREPTSSTRTKLSDALDRSARNALDVEASEAAVAAASEAVELDRDALAEDPDDPNLVWRLCTAERLLVRAHEATGHRATADALRDVVLDRARGLVQLDSSVRNLRLLSREIRSGMHDLDDAETLARMVELADVLARIAAETKTDADVTDAAECLGDLAEIHWENGLHDAAYDTLGRARALLIRPVTTPENVDLQVAALRMRSQQADVRFDQERDGEALALTAETLSALDQLIDDDGPSEMLTELVGTQLRRRVRTARRRGANDALLDVMREWTERTSAYARQTSSVELRLLSVQAREETARALRDHHRHIESWPIFEAALADIRQLADEHPDDAQIAAMLDVFEHPDDAFND